MHVGVVGRGLMGVGIVEVSARAALDVVVAESNDAAPKAGVARLEESREALHAQTRTVRVRR